MAMKSEYILKKEFHVVFKGYKPEEVDKFLDMMATEFENLVKKNRELSESLEKFKHESKDTDDDMDKAFKEALVSAHMVANDIKQKAKVEAEDIIEKAKSENKEKIKELEDQKAGLEKEIDALRVEYEKIKSSIIRDFENLKESLAGNSGVLEGTKADIEPEINEMDNEDELNKTEEDEEYIVEKPEEETFESDNEEEPLVESMDEPVDRPESTDEEKLKKERKKIDIANPDIINSFFKADED